MHPRTWSSSCSRVRNQRCSVARDTPSAVVSDLTALAVEQIDLGDMELWEDGFPHEVFERLRREDPVHWSPMATWENEPGFWSITRAEDVHEISREWETFSSNAGGVVV